MADPVFRYGGSILRQSGTTIDPAILQQQKDALGLAQTSLGNIQKSRGGIGTMPDFIAERTKGLKSGIEKQSLALTERLQKTGVAGEFGRQTQKTFAETARQKINTGEIMAAEEFNALSGKFDLMEGGAAELLKSIDMNDFAQQMQARGLSQELTSKLTRIAQGKDAVSAQEDAQDQQTMGTLVMAAAMIFSDSRLKRSIKKIGELANGLNIYSYVYLWGEHAVGVIAQEVIKIIPDAVVKHKSGFYMVDYSKVLENG